MVTLFLIFWGTAMVFSLVTASFTFPSAMHKGSSVFTPLSTLVFSSFLYLSPYLPPSLLSFLPSYFLPFLPSFTPTYLPSFFILSILIGVNWCLFPPFKEQFPPSSGLLCSFFLFPLLLLIKLRFKRRSESNHMSSNELKSQGKLPT